jgi:hypothetical protein
MRLFRKRRMKAWIWQGAAVLAASLLGATASAQVYRCGNAYSSAPCAGGKAIDTTPPLSARGDLAGKTTIYLCQSYGGGQFWTREHCAQRDALVERMETVPSGMPFEQQVEMAQNQRICPLSAATAELSAPSSLRSAARSASPVSGTG